MSDQTPESATPTIIVSSEDGSVTCSGAWVVSAAGEIASILKSLSKRLQGINKVNANGITQMDSAGALLLDDLLDALRKNNTVVNVSGLKNKFQALFSLVSHQAQQFRPKKSSERKLPNFFYFIGEHAVSKFHQLLDFFTFFGELMIIIFQNIIRPHRIQWQATFRIMDDFGYRALPIVALMLFLIGVVLSYQLATELKVYGASIFVVDVSGIAILREFGPLIAAIIVAGRTSTSFAALIGTMKVNEEIDALRTMGIVPMERLVLPRIFGLIFALPLITVWADIFGTLGTMVMAKAVIHIDFYAFLERFRQAVALKQLILGLIKTPVFAVIISAVGCFQGFQTKSSADSVGKQTTTSAVQAIFLIIVADAAFSIVFSIMGI